MYFNTHTVSVGPVLLGRRSLLNEQILPTRTSRNIEHSLGIKPRIATTTLCSIPRGEKASNKRNQSHITLTNMQLQDPDQSDNVQVEYPTESSRPLHDPYGNTSTGNVPYDPPEQNEAQMRPSSYEQSKMQPADSLHPIDNDPPNFTHFRMLLASLLLTTVLAVGSAFDARNQCISHELYYLLDLVDDGSLDVNEMVLQAQQMECVSMFRSVILPVGGVTLVLGGLALWMIHRHVRYTDSLVHDVRPSHLSALVKLLVVLLGTLAIWTYGIFAIMLRPKNESSGNGRNPYNSLAAVDEMGHVGDNANLYYLSWISEGLIMALVYQVCVDCFRWCRLGLEKKSPDLSSHSEIDDLGDVHDDVQNMPSYTSSTLLASYYKERRKKWYQFMLQLRIRSGVWVAALFASIVVLTSSAYLYNDVLIDLASQISYKSSFRYREACSIIKGKTNLPTEFCRRASFSVISGGVASCMCVTAVILHLLVRRQAANVAHRQCGILPFDLLPAFMSPESSHIPLWCEFLLSFCLSILLGLNAVFATGVQGPAATVGNLYYASWLSFMLCLRICLGCFEEIYYIETHPETDCSESLRNAPSQDGSTSQQLSQRGSVSEGSRKCTSNPAEKERPTRLRKYFFLFIFSSVCAASAWDSAYNQDSSLTDIQKYLILAPIIVAGLSLILFLLCLKPRPYLFVSHFFFGGNISIICFGIWVIDLVLTMHSEDSWAVNGIGGIRMANLYYFSWAAIITAGLQMMSYLKPFLGEKANDVMLLVWGAIVKVAFVILGAAMHIWHSIGGNCTDEDNQAGAIAFCSRTVFAIVVALTGMCMGCFVLLVRGLKWPFTNRIRIHVEAVISVFLVLLFGVAVALITSIGGPGQSVGDLYYSTWLAFWVCIGIFMNCYDQIKLEEMEMEVQSYKNETGPEYVGFQY